jgi:cobaltochelatase CobS
MAENLQKEKEPMNASFDITKVTGKEGKYTSIPDTKYDVRKTFGIDVDWQVPGYADDTQNVPEVDKTYHFDPETTMAILAGFAHNRRVMVQGYHGTGKSTHIEQVAALLKWPCVRINLDSHVSRIDLLGKDMIVLKEGKQITEYVEGLLPWAIQNPVALVFDEYDAGRPDVMFVIQRVLESEGRLTLLDQNKVIRPHPAFRLFATANTVGLGDTTGLYHGTQQINQAQMDRWNIVAQLNYLEHDVETDIMLRKVPALQTAQGKELVSAMVQMADLTRSGFINGDLSTVMSPRTVLSWVENYTIFGDRDLSFRFAFMNKCDETEWPTLAEYYQRCFGVEILKK